MRAFTKSRLKGLSENWTKILCMSLIVALGFAFIFGVSITPSKARDSYSLSLKNDRISDFDIKSTSATGFSENEIQAYKDIEGSHVETAMALDAYSLDQTISLYDAMDNFVVSSLVKNGMSESKAKQTVKLMEGFVEDEEDFLTISPSLMSEGNDRIYCFDGEKSEDVNRFTLADGSLPASSNEILVNSLYHKKSETIGGKVDLFGKEYTITGYVNSPLVFARENEPDLITYEQLDSIYYSLNPLAETPSINTLINERLINYINNKLPSGISDETKQTIIDNLDGLTYSLPSVTDVYIRLEGRESYNLFSNEYFSYISVQKENIEAISPKAASILTLEEVYSYKLLKTACAKIDSICLVIPIFFLAVSGLVVSISLTRLIEEERSRIACQASLGYTDFQIGSKYYIIAILSTLLGIGIGLLAGYFFVHPIVYEAFQFPYLLPSDKASGLNYLLTLISAFAMVFVILLITYAALKNTLHPLPAELLLPKSPGEGSQTKLERTKLWAKLPFHVKSTFRNLVRYKKRLAMTVIAVGGSTAIVYLGFGLLDIVNALSKGGTTSSVSSSIIPVSYFLIGFAIFLSALVLYNLTDMSITERGREIATLEVLGYHDGETVLYLYREIAVMTLIGILVGIPLGVGIMKIVVIYLEFGFLSDIKPLSYIYSVLIVIGFAALIDVILLPKIKKIDMVSSLKSVD